MALTHGYTRSTICSNQHGHLFLHIFPGGLCYAKGIQNEPLSWYGDSSRLANALDGFYCIAAYDSMNCQNMWDECSVLVECCGNVKVFLPWADGCIIMGAKEPHSSSHLRHWQVESCCHIKKGCVLDFLGITEDPGKMWRKRWPCSWLLLMVDRVWPWASAISGCGHKRLQGHMLHLN